VAEEASRKGDDRPQEFEYSRHRQTNQPERQQQKPDDRVQHQREDGDRPAQHQENAPEQEFHHVSPDYEFAPDSVPSSGSVEVRCEGRVIAGV
jgi:DNA relaxase NicK